MCVESEQSLHSAISVTTVQIDSSSLRHIVSRQKYGLQDTRQSCRASWNQLSSILQHAQLWFSQKDVTWSKPNQGGQLVRYKCGNPTNTHAYAQYHRVKGLQQHTSGYGWKSTYWVCAASCPKSILHTDSKQVFSIYWVHTGKVTNHTVFRLSEVHI